MMKENRMSELIRLYLLNVDNIYGSGCGGGWRVRDADDNNVTEILLLFVGDTMTTTKTKTGDSSTATMYGESRFNCEQSSESETKRKKLHLYSHSLVIIYVLGWRDCQHKNSRGQPLGFFIIIFSEQQQTTTEFTKIAVFTTCDMWQKKGEWKQQIESIVGYLCGIR